MSKLLLLISVLPVYFVGLYIYNKDKNKEPNELLKKLFLSGFLSTIITLLISFILELISPVFSQDIDNLNLIELFINVFIGVALVEEFSKWIMVNKIAYNSKYFDETYDMIIYAVFVSLGFACLENILYVFTGGIGTGIARALFAVPGHACYGVFMGYYLSLAKQNKISNNISGERKNKILSLIIPSLLHGIYDYCILSKMMILIIVFFIFVITIYIISIRKIKKTSSESKLLRKANFCSKCGYPASGNYCGRCGNKINGGTI